MIQHWEEASKYSDSIDNPENQKNLGHILNNLGLAYYGNNRVEEAIDRFNKSIEVYKTLQGPNDISVGNRLNNLAEAYRN